MVAQQAQCTIHFLDEETGITFDVEEGNTIRNGAIDPDHQFIALTTTQGKVLVYKFEEESKTFSLATKIQL